MMMGAGIQYHANKLRHVGSAGSSENEYMELERASRRVMWLRNVFFAMQIFRTSGLALGPMNFGKETRLYNRTSTFLHRQSGRMLQWLCVYEKVDYGGKWAIVDELGTSTIQVIAESVSTCGQNGPDPDTVWLVRKSDSEYIVDTSVTIIDVVAMAALIEAPTIVIGDNITALKWASEDAVTPGNAHIRASYHWIKDTIRDGDIDLRDIASVLNLADFLTKIVLGPAMRQASDAASGYTRPPPIPPPLAYF